MDLDEMIEANFEREEQEQNARRRQLDGLFSRLAAIVGGADGALAHAGNDSNGLRDAFTAVRNQLVQLLEENEIMLLGRPGDTIDPLRHVVEETRDDPFGGPPHVVEVLSYGALATREERLLTPARVVAAIPTKKSEA